MSKELSTRVSVLETKHHAGEEAKRLYADVIAGRLENLNGEAGRIREILGRTVSREVYDVRQTALDAQIAELRRLVYIGVGLVIVIASVIGVMSKT